MSHLSVTLGSYTGDPATWLFFFLRSEDRSLTQEEKNERTWSWFNGPGKNDSNQDQDHGRVELCLRTKDTHMVHLIDEFDSATIQRNAIDKYSKQLKLHGFVRVQDFWVCAQRTCSVSVIKYYSRAVVSSSVLEMGSPSKREYNVVVRYVDVDRDIVVATPSTYEQAKDIQTKGATALKDAIAPAS